MLKRFTAFLLLFALLFATGCTQQQPSESSSDIDPSTVPVESEPVASSQEVIEPTEMSLYDWWRDYIYDATYSLQSNYPTIPQYDTAQILEYCGIRMLRDGKTEGTIQQKGDESILPVETLDEYTRRYFDTPLSELDTLKRTNDDRSAVLYYLPTNDQDIPDETLNKNGVFTLVDAQYHDDGTVTLQVDRDDHLVTYFTMAPNSDGSYHFQKIEQVWGNGSAESGINVSGEFRTIDTLLHRDARIGSGRTSSYGEIGGRILLLDASMGSSYIMLSLVSTQDLNELYSEIRLDKDESFVNAKAQESGILVLTNKRIITMGSEFKDYQEMPFPDAVLQKFDTSIPVFDVTEDMRKAVYSGEEGLMLLDLHTGEETLLAKHPNYNPEDADKSSMMSWQTFGYPAFYDHDSKIQVGIYGYEHTVGKFIYDLKTQEGKTFDNTYGWINFDTVVDGKVIAFNRQNYENNPNFMPNVWIDQETGEEHPIILPEGVQYVEFAQQDDTFMVLGNLGGYQYQLYRLNLETMQLEKQEFSFSGTNLEIIGATNNGRILLMYFDLDSGEGAYILAPAPSN